MSNNASFYVQGRIEPNIPFHIAAKIDVASNVAKFNGPTTGDGWAVLGVQEKYTNFDEVKNKPFYYFSGTHYYYPMYFHNNGNTYTDAGPLGITWKPDTYIDENDPEGTTIAGSTTPPPAHLKLKSHIALERTTYYAESTQGGYMYDLKLDYDTNIYSANDTANYDVTLEQVYPIGPIQGLAVDSSLRPNPVQCFFGNPYEMLCDSTFTHSEKDGNVYLQLASSGHYLENVNKYKYIYSTGGNSVTASETPNDAGYFVLNVPSTYNLNTVNKFAGVPYSLYVRNGSATENAKFDLAYEMTNNFTLSHYFDSTGTPSTTSIMPGMPIHFDILGATALTQLTGNFDIYFVPSTLHTYQVSTNDALVYLDYTAFDMLAASPQVYNVRPLIIDGPAYSTGATNYYNWRTTTGLSTAHNELAFVTSLSDSLTRIVPRYCGENEYCGACLGHCDPKDATTVNCRCFADALSVDKIGTAETFTCDQERYIEKSQYVSRGTFANHSKTLIIFIIVLVIILIAGFVLYEERNRIFKQFLKHKKR